jgi:shikimate dehydrogenase
MHQVALQSLGLEGRYRLFSIQPGIEGETQLRETINGLRVGRLHGLNVTIPHKQAVIPMVDDLAPVAREVGAVNTIINRDGRLLGENTDVPGFLADLAALGVNPAGGGKALVMGAGGSARAVVYALAQAGWIVTLAARRAGVNLRYSTEEYQTISLTIRGLEPALAGCRLIVNATPAGMYPDTDFSPWPEELPYPPGAIVYDLVYNPVVTRLVRQARAAGLAAHTGLGMLVEQAALSFEYWVGQAPPREAMRLAAESKLAQRSTQ